MDTSIQAFKPKWEIFPPNWKTILSKNIRAERDRLDISQQELAQNMGVKGGDAVSNWERGKGFFNIDMLVLLGEYLGRSPNELLTQDLSGSSPPPKQSPLSIERDDGGERGGGGEESPAAAESPPAALESAADIKAARKKAVDFLSYLERLEAVELPPSNFDKASV